MELNTLYNKKNKMDSGGFTLIEVIASLAILGIIVVAFLPFFPQIMGWSKTTEDQLTESNYLDEVVYLLKDANDDEEIVLEAPKKLELSKGFSRTINNESYLPEINLLKQTDEEIKLNLFRAHIILGEQETFVYLKDYGAKP